MFLKKTTLHPTVLTSYYSILSLQFLSKLVEKVAVERLHVFLDDASTLDPFLSSFHPGHGMEIALVSP